MININDIMFGNDYPIKNIEILEYKIILHIESTYKKEDIQKLVMNAQLFMIIA